MVPVRLGSELARQRRGPAGATRRLAARTSRRSRWSEASPRVLNTLSGLAAAISPDGPFGISPVPQSAPLNQPAGTAGQHGERLRHELRPEPNRLRMHGVALGLSAHWTATLASRNLVLLRRCESSVGSHHVVPECTTRSRSVSVQFRSRSRPRSPRSRTRLWFRRRRPEVLWRTASRSRNGLVWPPTTPRPRMRPRSSTKSVASRSGRTPRGHGRSSAACQCSCGRRRARGRRDPGDVPSSGCSQWCTLSRRRRHRSCEAASRGRREPTG